ncbi:MAG TPA: response regulator [Acetobacteraceae bacterium]|nr:response regulator [Acetobacteraceae bacterium]
MGIALNNVMCDTGWMVAAKSQERSPAKGQVLVVEDDVTLGEALCEMLRREGYATTLANGFNIALEILEGERPLDLMLVDIVMPDGVNGLALARMARLRRRDLKVIYVTGYSIPGLEREALGPILRKPVDDEVLLQEVRRALAG